MKTITFKITQPEELINLHADSLGYQEVVKNDNYAPTTNSEKIIDPEWDMPEDFDEATGEYPMIDNPDYVAEVENPTIKNPQSRLEFVTEKAKENNLNWLAQFAERTAKAQVDELVKQQVDKVKKDLAKTITVEIN